MSAYTRELVEELVPTLWSDAFAFGMVDSRAPDPDMPRGSSDPSHGCTLYAHLADIKAAWQHTLFGEGEPQALFLRHALGWKYDEIGQHQGVNKSTAQRRAENAIGRMTMYLNGDSSSFSSE